MEKSIKGKTVKKNVTGLKCLIGKRVTFFCMNYFYVGKLLSVDKDNAILGDAHIVYETGSFNEDGFKDAQRIAPEWTVRLSTVESYGVIPNK